MTHARGLFVCAVLGACSPASTPDVVAPPADATAVDGTGGDGDATRGDPTGSINDCTSTSYVDLRGADASHTVTFADFAYTPSCMRIAVGQSLTFAGNFARHQLRPGLAPDRAADWPGNSPNPVEARDDGPAATFVFPHAGVYPYFCYDHSFVMRGVIRVE